MGIQSTTLKQFRKQKEKKYDTNGNPIEQEVAKRYILHYGLIDWKTGQWLPDEQQIYLTGHEYFKTKEEARKKAKMLYDLFSDHYNYSILIEGRLI